MDDVQRFVWNKLITGGFRVGAAQRLVVRALAQFSRIDAAAISHRLMGGMAPHGRLLPADPLTGHPRCRHQPALPVLFV